MGAHGVEIVDSSGSWLFRVEPLPEDVEESSTGTPSLATLRATASLLEHVPAVQQVAAHRDIRVVFSKEITKLLRSGAAELVQSSKGALPVAREVGSKSFIEIGQVAPGAAAATVGGAATFGSLAAAATPVLVVAGVAAATAYAEQRVMEQRFAERRTGGALRTVRRLVIAVREKTTITGTP